MGRSCLTWNYSKAKVSKLFSVKSKIINILGFEPYVLCCIYSILPFYHESRHRQYVNKWLWLYSNLQYQVRGQIWPTGFHLPSPTFKASGTCFRDFPLTWPKVPQNWAMVWESSYPIFSFPSLFHKYQTCVLLLLPPLFFIDISPNKIFCTSIPCWYLLL